MNTEDPIGLDLSALYKDRFTSGDLAYKRALWEVLCERFFQRYIGPDDTLLDLGAGSCEFLRAIRCRHKIAVDLNPDCDGSAFGAEVHAVPGSAMAPVATGSVDVVFSSNFFEHMPNKGELLSTLRECRRVLKPGGKLLVLQPNIRYLPGRYWDYLDHHIPLTHVSMQEALRLTGFVPLTVIPRFLPYTVKDGRMPKPLFLVRAYLRLRFAWPLFGRQMFIEAVSSNDS